MTRIHLFILYLCVNIYLLVYIYIYMFIPPQQNPINILNFSKKFYQVVFLFHLFWALRRDRPVRPAATNHECERGEPKMIIFPITLGSIKEYLRCAVPDALFNGILLESTEYLCRCKIRYYKDSLQKRGIHTVSTHILLLCRRLEWGGQSVYMLQSNISLLFSLISFLPVCMSRKGAKNNNTGKKKEPSQVPILILIYVTFFFFF